jgi:hypothetical protein
VTEPPEARCAGSTDSPPTSHARYGSSYEYNKPIIHVDYRVPSEKHHTHFQKINFENITKYMVFSFKIDDNFKETKKKIKRKIAPIPVGG